MDAETPDKSDGYKKIIYFGPFCLDATERVLSKNGEPVSLLAKAFDLLLLLAESGGQLKTHDELIETLWPNTIVVENSLSWYVSAVRKALKDTKKGQRYIETVHKHGYRFTAPVRVERVPIKPPEEIISPETSFGGGSEGVEAVPGRDGEGRAGVDGSRAWRAPTRRRRIFWGLGAAAVVVIAGVLIWRFVPFGGSGKHSSAVPVIAVMPFENLSPDQNNAYFADGIQDTILSKLAGIDGLRVISRASTKHYPSHPVNLGKIATELGATAIMEGSVQKSGDRVLINVQLIDAKTHEHIWAHVYNRKLSDIFAVETHVATAVAGALQADLSPDQKSRLDSRPTHNVQAYLLYLKGNYYLSEVTNSSSAKNPSAAIAKSAALFHQAIAQDPGFALAWARLSILKSLSYYLGISRTAQTAFSAEHSAEQALALSPRSPETSVAMGYVAIYVHRNYAEALARLKQAHQIWPSNASIIATIAFIHRRQGKWQESLSGLQKAINLNPRFPGWYYGIGASLAMLRRYNQAIQPLDYALALNPANHTAAALKAATLLLAGKPAKEVRDVLANIPGDNNQHGFVYALRFKLFLLSHRPRAALAALDDAPGWIESPNANGQEPVSLLRAQAWAMQGEKEQSHKSYEKARSVLYNAQQKRPKDANLWAFLGLAEAGLGHKQQAIQAGRKAMTLVPVVKDAIDGPSYLVTMAKIYAKTGKPEQAIKLLSIAMKIPAGLFISVSLLERDPVWDPLRKNPTFQKLIKEFANKPPPPIP